VNEGYVCVSVVIHGLTKDRTIGNK
jgi:hypothetical protein